MTTPTLAREQPVHYSNLKRFDLSAAHYLASLDSNEDSSAKALGRLAHCLVLGGRYTIFEGKTRQGKAWEAFEEEHAGEEIYTTSQYEQASAIAGAVLMDPLMAPYLRGEKEKLIDWSYLGRACQSRLDVVGLEPFICDLKTTSCAKPDWFGRHAIKMRYHAQLAFYMDAARASGKDVREAYILAVETKPPYARTVHRLSPRVLEQGRRFCRLWFEELLQCEAAGVFPGYTQSVCELDIDEDFGLIIEGDEEAA